MLKLQHVFRPVNVQEEREFERANVAAKTARYLATNPMNRYAEDVAYREKVDRIAAGLEGINDLVLDVGGNTAGEATILNQEGFRFVVGDINEVALDISRQRVEKFGLRQPRYVALDVHSLPFKDASFSAITVIEAIHHFPDYARALSEILRVLRPGGRLFSLEPNALSPLRRASEVRDRLRGTVEKSFYRGQLRQLCEAAGFENVRVEAIPTARSSWKKHEIPLYRRPLWHLHGWLAVAFPTCFGSLRLQANKPGTLKEPSELSNLESLLQSPKTRGGLRFEPTRQLWMEADGRTGFPDVNGIALLVPEDAVEL